MAQKPKLEEDHPEDVAREDLFILRSTFVQLKKDQAQALADAIADMAYERFGVPMTFQRHELGHKPAPQVIKVPKPIILSPKVRIN